MSMTLFEIYSFAEHENIDIDYFKMHENISLSVPNAVAIDRRKLKTTAEEITCLCHELGHCMTGSFYNSHSLYDLRAKHEYRADKWAAYAALPYDNLVTAIEIGYTEVWQLAEYFNVTENFIRRTIYIYDCEGKFSECE